MFAKDEKVRRRLGRHVLHRPIQRSAALIVDSSNARAPVERCLADVDLELHRLRGLQQPDHTLALLVPATTCCVGYAVSDIVAIHGYIYRHVAHVHGRTLVVIIGRAFLAWRQNAVKNAAVVAHVDQ